MFLFLTLVLIFFAIISVILFMKDGPNNPPFIYLCTVFVLTLTASLCFNEWYKEGLHNYQAKVNTKIECSPSEQVKQTSNRDKDILILDKENKNIYKLETHLSRS